MPNHLDKMTLDISCTSCGKKTAKSIAWLKSHNVFVCGICGSSFPIDRNQISTAIDKAAKALPKFGKGIRKL